MLIVAVFFFVPGSALAASPTACFSQNPAGSIKTGQTVTFDSSCSTDPDNDIRSRAWDLDNDGQFDDGTGVTASASTTTPGTYTIRLSVTDAARNTNIASKTVTITNPPVASFTVNPASPTSGQAITFTSTSSDPDGSIAAVAWDTDGDATEDFNDGTTTSVSKTFALPGTYTIRLRATDNRGTTAITTKSVTVANRAPTPNFSINPATPLSGQLVTFTSTSTDPDGTVKTTEWDTDGDAVTDFADGSGGSVSRTYAKPGQYPVRVRVTDDKGAQATVTKVVTVGNRPPVANFTVDPSAPVEGGEVTLTSTSTDDGGISTSQWDLDNDGAYDDATGSAVKWTPPQAGAFTVGVRVVDTNGAAATASKTVTVAQKPPSDSGQPVPEPRNDTQTFDVSTPIADPLPPAPVAPVNPLRFLSPFPTVRMRGRTTSKGAKLSLLSVKAPHGSTVKVACKGGGCPSKRQVERIKTKSKRGAATVRFSRYERFLRAGTELQIDVTKKGMVGKYTRIKIRKLKLPVRTDRCLLPDKPSKPTTCPART